MYKHTAAVTFKIITVLAPLQMISETFYLEYHYKWYAYFCYLWADFL